MLRRVFFTVILAHISVVFGGAGTATAASPNSELLIAWWGDMRSIQYPATERDPEVVQAVTTALRTFRETHPDALLLDTGGFVGPLMVTESTYELPPLPLYESIDVAAVNLAMGDWSTLLPADKILEIPRPKRTRLLSTGRMANGQPPPAVDTAIPVSVRDIPVVIAGTTQLRALPFSQLEELQLQVGRDPVPLVKESITSLVKDSPSALTILLADLPREDAVRVAEDIPDLDLILLNTPRTEPRPQRIGKSTWIVERYEAGSIAVGKVRLGPDGTIDRIDVQKQTLVQPRKAGKNLWTWLGVAKPKNATSPLARVTEKPIIGINLKDPTAVAKEIGYEDAQCEARRCDDIPEPLRERIANKRVVSFLIRQNDTEIGRMYRVHHEMISQNLDLVMNVVFDDEGRLVRTRPRSEPIYGARYILLSKILEEWEGQEPADVPITPEKYPGIDEHLKVIRDDLELAAEIHRHCR